MPVLLLLPPEWREWLWRPWWRWEPVSAGTGDWAYHLFNLVEAAAWLLTAAIVFTKRHPASRHVDLWLAGLLVLFALSDVAEAWILSVPLAAGKLAILMALLSVRRKRNARRAVAGGGAAGRIGVPDEPPSQP